jgi:hypothetical protein
MGEHTTYHILHKIEPTFREGFVTLDDYVKVATVTFVTPPSTEDAISLLWRITNSVDGYWAQQFCNIKYHDRFIMEIVGENHRSSSVGDLFCNGTTVHEVAPFGFNTHQVEGEFCNK